MGKRNTINLLKHNICRTCAHIYGLSYPNFVCYKKRTKLSETEIDTTVCDFWEWSDIHIDIQPAPEGLNEEEQA
jgi:lipopolysaccharide biosynthesis protein